jgi:hypothetical protein
MYIFVLELGVSQNMARARAEKNGLSRIFWLKYWNQILVKLLLV